MRLLLLLPLLAACLVPKKKYDALAAELAASQTALATANADLASTKTSLDAEKSRGTDLEAALASAKQASAALQAEIDALNAQKAALMKDQKGLKSSVEEMQKALNELAQRKAAADARVAEFRNLLDRFRALIDAGKLRVKIVDGRMIVELATDVLFASGSAALSNEGKAAIVEVTAVLRSIGDKKFQVEGHTDNVPIKTAQFPSNWELAAARSLTVVKTMVEAGMTGDRVSAASFGDTRPVGANDSDAGKASNRRIEIVLVPDLTGMPGFDELAKIKE